MVEINKENLSLAYPELIAEIQSEAYERGKKEGKAQGKLEVAVKTVETAKVAIPKVERVLTLEEQAIANWKNDTKLHSEFTDITQYAAFLRAEVEGRVNIVGKRG